MIKNKNRLSQRRGKTFLSWLVLTVMGISILSPSAEARLIFTTEDDGAEADTYTLDVDGTVASGENVDLSLIFGANLGEELKYNDSLGYFILTGSLNLEGNELQEFRVGQSAGAPVVCNAANVAYTYYDTTVGSILVCNETVVGSGTYAFDSVEDVSAGAITTAELLDGTIATVDIADDAITSAKIDDGAVATVDLADDAVTSDKIDDGTVAPVDLADDAVTADKLADNAVGTAAIANDAITSDKIADGAISGGLGGQITDGTITADDLGTASVDADEIAADAVGASELADNAVDTAAVADDAVTIAKIGTAGVSDANQVLTTDAAGDPLWTDVSTFATSNLSSGQIFVGNALNNAVGVVVSGDATIDNTGAFSLAADSVDSAEIATDAVGSDEIATDAVGSAEIATDAVDSDEIAADAVGSSEIATDAVDSAEIATDAVGSDEIAAGAVDTAELADNSVDGAKLGIGTTAGDTLYYDGTDWIRLGIGTSGQVLQTNAGATAPEWAAAAAGNLLGLSDTNITAPAGGNVLVYDSVNSEWDNVALSGDVTITEAGVASLAADSVDSAEIADDAVGSTEIATDAVGSDEIATDAVDSDEIAAGAVGSSEIATDAVDSDEIATDAVGSDEIATDAVGADELDLTDVTLADFTNDLALTDTQVFVGNGSNVATGVAISGDATIDNTGALSLAADSVDSAEIATDAVGSTEIATDAVGSDEILAGAVDTAELADNSVDGTKLGIGTAAGDTLYYDGTDWVSLGIGTSGQVLQTNAGADAPEWAAAAAGSFTGLSDTNFLGLAAGNLAVYDATNAEWDNVALSGDVTITETGVASLAADSVDSAEIADDAVGATEIATDAVGSDEIAADAVGASEIATDAVGSDEIATDAVDSDEIATDAVGADELDLTDVTLADFTNDLALNDTQVFIGNGSNVATGVTVSGDATITNTGVINLETDSVDSDEIVANAVDSAEIATDAVGSDEIATDAVDSDEIAAGAVDTAELADNSVDGTKLGIGTAAGDTLYYDGTDWISLGIGSAGQVLQTNAGATAPEWAAAAAGNLLGLSDTNITAPAAGNVLVYDATNSEWDNVAISGDATISDTGVVSLAADSVDSAEIADDAVGSTEIATDAVGSDEIATDAVDSDEIAADAVGSSEIATDAVDSDEIATDAVGSDEIATDAVDSDEIAADAVGDSEIDYTEVTLSDFTNDLTLNDAQIFVGDASNVSTPVTISGDATLSNTGVLTLTADSIATGDIVDGTITADDLATDSVDSDEIATDAVDSDEIATDAVDSDEIATDAVDSDEIATGAVTTDEILDDTITQDDLQEREVTLSVAPEFSNFTLRADGSNNRGTFESNHDSTTDRNFYQWSTRRSNEMNDYDLVFQWMVPENFTGFSTTLPEIELDYKTDTTDLLDNRLDLISMLDTAGSAVTLTGGTGLVSTVADTWVDDADVTFAGGTFTPGEYITLVFRFASEATTRTDRNPTFLGPIRFNVLVK